MLTVLRKEPTSSCQLICLETIKILTRDKLSLDPFVSHLALSTLAYYAGIFTPNENQSQQIVGKLLLVYALLKYHPSIYPCIHQ